MPVLVLTCIVLAISIIGIPLLLLMPFVRAVRPVPGAGGLHRRGAGGRPVGSAAVRLGVAGRVRRHLAGDPDRAVPVLIGRVIALGGFLAGPVSILLVAGGVALEFLAWSTGFGAVLTNGFSRWQARRAMRRRRIRSRNQDGSLGPARHPTIQTRTITSDGCRSPAPTNRDRVSH